MSLLRVIVVACLDSIQYSGKDVDHLDESIDQQIANLIRLVEAKYLTTDTDFRPVDIARKVQYLTLDVISTIAFGRTIGFTDNDDEGKVRATTSSRVLSIVRTYLDKHLVQVQQCDGFPQATPFAVTENQLDSMFHRSESVPIWL